MENGIGFMGFVYGTAILYICTYLVVVPITRGLCGDRTVASARRHDAPPDLGMEVFARAHDLHLQREKLSDPQYDNAIDSLPTGSFIAVDCAVLGILGLVSGVAGYFLLGGAHKAKLWPGVFLMDFCNILGLVLGIGVFGLHR